MMVITGFQSSVPKRTNMLFAWSTFLAAKSDKIGQFLGVTKIADVLRLTFIREGA